LTKRLGFPVTSKHGTEELRRFLVDLGFDRAGAQSLAETVETENRASRANVKFTAEQLKRYGLGEMSIGESIKSYLST
jgi:hypothetical protein